MRKWFFDILNTILVELEHGEEGLLRHLHVADLLHALLTLLLLLEKLALTRYVATVALGRHVLAHLLHRLAGDNLATDGGLDGNVELLAGDEFLELLTHAAAEVIGVVDVSQGREGIHGFAIEQDVELHEARGTVPCGVVVKRGVALGDALELVVEVDDDFTERHEVVYLHAIARDVLLLHEFAAVG